VRGDKLAVTFRSPTAAPYCRALQGNSSGSVQGRAGCVAEGAIDASGRDSRPNRAAKHDETYMPRRVRGPLKKQALKDDYGAKRITVRNPRPTQGVASETRCLRSDRRSRTIRAGGWRGALALISPRATSRRAPCTIPLDECRALRLRWQQCVRAASFGRFGITFF